MKCSIWCITLLVIAAIRLDAACISGGTDADIRNALSGPNSEAVLCQYSSFMIYNEIILTHDGQKIYTEGRPGHSAKRATLQVASYAVQTLINGVDRWNIELNSLRLDGGAVTFGYVRGGASKALVEIGGDAKYQEVRDIEAFEPRGWSIIHVFEGANKGCEYVTVVYNALHEAGKRDGTNHADGISLACGIAMLAITMSPTRRTAEL